MESAEYKPKKQRKAEKLALKERRLQQSTSNFTDAYRLQQHHSQQDSQKSPDQPPQQHSFHVEDYLLL